MRAYVRNCGCGPARFVLAKTLAAAVWCTGCGQYLDPVKGSFRAPSRPVRRVTFPTSHREDGFGRLHLYRKIIGARTANGQTEILCRYGEDIEKWYPVAA